MKSDGKFISVFTLGEDERYGRPETYTEEDIVKVSIFEDLEIDLGIVFSVS